MTDQYLQNLNEAQRKAITHTEGPLLVLAGAGTGKTRVLTSRIFHILSENLAFPSQIIAVTFTNKAAREMQERITNMSGGQSEGLWLGTFHSICLRILRKHCELVGLEGNFTILDADDQVRLIKQIELDENIDIKKHPPQSIANIIQSWKDKGITIGKIDDDSIAAKIYEIYQDRLIKLNSCDFGDLLLYCFNILSGNPAILAEYQRKFRYILVDEYQDTNVIQYLWLRLLAQGSGNICCVGDDDQSIYGWRGAEIGNILRFEKDFPDASIIRLECNYRSTPHILAVASHLISFNESRLGKTLYCDVKKGGKVKVASLWDDRSEAKYTAQEIEKRRNSQSLDEFAVLVRAGHQTRSFEECFINMNIPYRIIGGLRFYERREIRDAIAYIRATVQPHNDLAFGRIINVPKRGIGKTTVDKLREYGRVHNLSMINAIYPLCNDGIIKGKATAALHNMASQFESWKNLSSMIPHRQLVETILNESGYIDMWKQEKTPEAQGRVENLKELMSALEEFETIGDFLEHVSLVMDGDENYNTEMVNIVTMHGAKGLEFNTVFLTGWEEGLFPSQRSIDEKGKEGLEEERRLAYVGITRAKRHLTISFASNRFLFGQNISSIPSRFIDELPKDHIEIDNRYGPGAATPDKSQEAQAQRRFKNRKNNNITKKQSGNGKFIPGDRVFHHKFGPGQVSDVKGRHVTVAFNKNSVRTLMDDFLRKAR